MHFLPFQTIKTIDITDGKFEITWCSDDTSRKPCNITSRHVLCIWQTMLYVVLLTRADMHLGQSEDVYRLYNKVI